MINSNRRLQAAVLAALLAAACSPPEPEQSAAETAARTEEPSADVMAQMSGAQAGGTAHPGARPYTEHCAGCHEGRVARAPHKSFLEMMAPDMILLAMNEGVMQQQARALAPEQRAQVVEYLVGSQPEPSPFEPVR